jgi:hypothetical protein
MALLAGDFGYDAVDAGLRAPVGASCRGAEPVRLEVQIRGWLCHSLVARRDVIEAGQDAPVNSYSPIPPVVPAGRMADGEHPV